MGCVWGCEWKGKALGLLSRGSHWNDVQKDVLPLSKAIGLPFKAPECARSSAGKAGKSQHIEKCCSRIVQVTLLRAERSEG